MIGAGGDGWWHDRPAAVRRLLGRLSCYAARTGEHVELVLDVAQPDLPAGAHDGVTVMYATRRGRDAADDRIRERLADVDDGPVEVVTSDRALGADAALAGAAVTGAGTFLTHLASIGC